MDSEEEHDSKRQKTVDRFPVTQDGDDDSEESSELGDQSPSTVSSDDEENERLFNEEFEKHGAYDFDASKVGRTVIFYPVKFEESEYAEEPETDGDLMAKLSRVALKQYNDNNGTSFELVRAVKANWSLGGGNVFSITLEAKEASPHSQTIPFHAKVCYLPMDTWVFDVYPKP